MQSTGQTGTQRSQPLHSVGITVCMRLAIPMIASTGHTTMHFVQPMHSVSSIQATRRSCSMPHETPVPPCAPA